MKRTACFPIKCVLAVLLSVCLLSFLFSCAGCGHEDLTDSSEPSSVSSVSDVSEPGDSSPEPDASESPASEDSAIQRFYRSSSFTLTDLAAAGGKTFERLIPEGETDPIISSVPGENDGTPFLSNVFFTREGDCFAAVADAFERTSEGTKVSYRLVRYLPETDSWEGTDSEPSPYAYSRDADNRTGAFRIEYDDSVSAGKPCPYVVLYREFSDDQEHILYYRDKAVEYPRIIRQNDSYAILSLLRGESREYAVIDRDGQTLFSFHGEEDLNECYPLTFYGDKLLCKADTDDDYEYDTLVELDPASGGKRAIRSCGNFGYWTFSADGSVVFLYDVTENGSQCAAFLVSEFNLFVAFNIDMKISSAHPFGKLILAETENGKIILFDGMTGANSGPLPYDSRTDSLVLSGAGFAVWSADGVDVYRS